MKLSEAIREGAKLRPQNTAWGYFKEIDGVLCSCAIGAAVEAVDGTFSALNRLYKGRGDVDLASTFSEFADSDRDDSLYHKIIDMNDQQKMTREQIADWVEQQGH